jgi:hypothetical protein
VYAGWRSMDTGQRKDVDGEVLAHVWLAHHEDVHFCGTPVVDIDSDLAQLDAGGYEPLLLSQGDGSGDRCWSVRARSVCSRRH